MCDRCPLEIGAINHASKRSDSAQRQYPLWGEPSEDEAQHIQYRRKHIRSHCLSLSRRRDLCASVVRAERDYRRDNQECRVRGHDGEPGLCVRRRRPEFRGHLPVEASSCTWMRRTAMSRSSARCIGVPHTELGSGSARCAFGRCGQNQGKAGLTQKLKPLVEANGADQAPAKFQRIAERMICLRRESLDRPYIGRLWQIAG